MNKFNQFFINIGCNIAMHWWCFWSNIRYCRALRMNSGTKDCDKASTLRDIETLVKKLYLNFQYTKDGPKELYDAICPPPQNYFYYTAGVVKDDCDGFHSLSYHCLYNSKIDCYLLSVVSFKSSHCVLLFTLNDKWYINDYTRILCESNSAEETIKKYNAYYTDHYQASEVVYNATIKYDYNKCKFKVVKIK